MLTLRRHGDLVRYRWASTDIVLRWDPVTVSIHGLSAVERRQSFHDDFSAAELRREKARLDLIFDAGDQQRYYEVRDRLFPGDRSGSRRWRNRAGDKLYSVLVQSSLVDDLRHTESFVDIAGGPGAFSEVLLTMMSRGYGITIADGPGWYGSLFDSDFTAIYSPVMVVRNRRLVDRVHREGSHRLGNLYEKDNVEILRLVVETPVKIVVADGGFKIDRDDDPVRGRLHVEHLQEIYSHRLILSEIFAGISLLATGGHLICKLFDVFTEFSSSLVWLMALIFDEILIVKPERSRDVNSERYLVCKNLLTRDLVYQKVFALLDRVYNEWRDHPNESPQTLVSQRLIEDLTPEFLPRFRTYVQETSSRQRETLRRVLDRL